MSDEDFLVVDKAPSSNGGRKNIFANQRASSEEPAFLREARDNRVIITGTDGVQEVKNITSVRDSVKFFEGAMSQKSGYSKQSDYATEFMLQKNQNQSNNLTAASIQFF